MKKRIKYSDEPMEAVVIPDFLPPPEVLRRALTKVRVTVEVEAPTARLFQKKAGKRPDDALRMMGKLLDLYAMGASGAKR